MSNMTATQHLEIIREKNRPTVNDYIPAIFNHFTELHGDRHYGDDAAILSGIATLNSTPVTVIAQVKGRNLEENKKSNFSMPHPEGYRKALRLAYQAEKFHRPVICFVDTPGAFCGVEAEKNTCRKGYFDSRQAVGIRYLLHLGAFNLGSFGSLLVHLVSDGNAGTRTYCSTYRSSNGCPLAFTYQSADNGTCCCTGATADYSTFGLVVHCAATAQQQCAAQK